MPQAVSGTRPGAPQIEGLPLVGKAAPCHLRLTGRWTALFAGVMERLCGQLHPVKGGAVVLDCGGLDGLDMTGAFLLVKLRMRCEAQGCAIRLENLRPGYGQLMKTVNAQLPKPVPKAGHGFGFFRLLARCGAAACDGWRDGRAALGLLGVLCVTLVRAIRDPRILRPVAILDHFSRIGIGASGIVVLTSLLVGGIIAQQGGFYLQNFAADIYVVDLSAVLVLREIGLFLAAIIVAGRSGSAITAELGLMKTGEEIDALRVIGLPPAEVLLLPRLIAVVLALPILCFLADVAALFGACLVSWAYLDITPTVFWNRFENVASPAMIAVGLIKAPFMALIIAIVACLEGMKVSRSSLSLGRHTTRSVVKTIFLVIVVDGGFAMIFAAIGL